MARAPRRLRGIVRIEQPARVHSGGRSGPSRTWWVRLFLREGVFLVQKTFPDGRHGGRRRALEAAIAWRDEQLAMRRNGEHQAREVAHA